MEQIASEVVGPVVNILTGQITKHLGYVTSSRKHVADMRNKMKVLEGKGDDVKRHMETNKKDNKDVPARVEGWLGEVENVKNEVQRISGNGIGCLDMKKRYRAGRNALKTINEIELLISEEKEINWSDAKIPLGRVDSKPASTHAPSTSGETTPNGFESRDEKFKKALKFLQQDDKASQVIALCGMGGVGKTTMMEQLKKVAEDNKMFHWIAKAVIGQNLNMFSVQKDIAVYIGDSDLPEASISVRADHLYKKFVKLSEAKEKTLVILDDVWEKIELKDIGLRSPLPNGVKLLLTSRDSNVCTRIAVAADLVLQEVKVDALEEAEAQKFFSQTTGVSEEDDVDKYLIGCGIVKKCGGLPLAIKLIASTLKSKEDYEWTNALNRLKNNDLDKNVQEITKISYEYIEEDEDKQIFLHCSLFPEDSDIPIEDLMRHAWGLKLLKNVSTLREARDRTNTCVQNLINANLLMSSDHVGFVKMHDLVLAFVLGRVSKGDPAWIINHGDISDVSKWEKDEICNRISLTCTGLSEFPRDFRHPNLSLLQLMNGDLSLTFPVDFYEHMENLKVVAYYKMQYPPLPKSLINLKSLCLHECRLAFDCSYIGYLENLEVLSFAHCGIRKLPCLIGNLKRLKLLDLKGCFDLRIDDGVFKGLKNLEELYMRVPGKKAIRLTAANFEELGMLLSQLSALEAEFEFVEKKNKLKSFSFTKLYKFKIAIGCLFEEEENDENILKLVIDSGNDLRDCKIGDLFKKTCKLHLQVKDMIRLQDVSRHPYDKYSFSSLRDLEVSHCAELKYLFPIHVASGLRKLERLKITLCPVLEALVLQNDTCEISSAIKFEKLKFLSLKNLPKLVCLFLVDNVVELPQLVELEVYGLPNFTSIYHHKNALLNSKVRISKLKKLKIQYMKNLKQIWDASEEDVSNPMNPFTTNPTSLLNHLERLIVESCDSLEVIFNKGMELVTNNVILRSGEVLFQSEKVGEVCRITGDENIKFEKLKFLSLQNLPKLVCLFLVDNGVELPQLIELEVYGLRNFTSIYADKNINVLALLDSKVKISELKKLKIEYMENLKQIWAVSNQPSEEEVNNISMLREFEVHGCGSLVNLFPTNPMRLLNHLEKLMVDSCGSIEELFIIDLECVGQVELVTNSRLKSITVQYLDKLREVWRIIGGENNSNSSLFIRGFEAVEMLYIHKCKMFRNVFTSTNTNFTFDMRAVINIVISCRRTVNWIEEEVPVLSRKDGDSNISNVALSSNANYLRKLYMDGTDGVDVVFEIESHTTSTVLPNLQDIELFRMKRTSHLWKCSNWNKFLILQKQSTFHNLATIKIHTCPKFKYLFSPLMAKLLSNLKSIEIRQCNAMEEVVSKRDDNDEAMTACTATTFFPHLHSLIFSNLRILKRIGGGCGAKSTTSIIHDQFKASHDTVVPWFLCHYSRDILIDRCESLKEVFETKRINNNSGGGTDNTSVAIPRLEKIHVPQLFNLKKLVITSCNLLTHLFIFSTLESLGQLEELMIKECKAMEVIVKEENGDQIRKDVVFPRLKSFELVNLPNLEGFFLGKNGFQWPVLEKVMINKCPQMKMFTLGLSTAPELNYIHTSLGKHSLECGLNFHVTSVHQTWLPSLERLLWSFHNLIELDMGVKWRVNDLEVKYIIPSNQLLQLQKLERIRLRYISCVEVVFEVLEGTQTTVVEIPNLRQVEFKHLYNLKYIWKSNHPQRTVLEFPNLTTLSIKCCNSLKHVFTSSMVGSLLQLQHLHIRECSMMEVIIVKEEEEECDAKVKEIVKLPRLISLKLEDLYRLEGFFLGKNDFSWPSLHTLEITKCPGIKVFTKGHSATPMLNVIDTAFGRCYLREDINSFIKTKQQEGFKF